MSLDYSSHGTGTAKVVDCSARIGTGYLLKAKAIRQI